MRSTNLLVLLLVAACGDPFATEGYSMAGTWTLVWTFEYFDNGGASGQIYTIHCAGPTTATLTEDKSGNISGATAGVVPCTYTDGQPFPGGLEMSSNLRGIQDAKTLSLHWGGGGGGSCWHLPGNMVTPTMAEGTLSAACGYTGATGTWSASRE